MRSTAVAWHDVECAAYAADLELWRELADAATGPVLDLGCGTGRVALDLADRGHSVTAVDADAELVAELARRARERGLRVDSLAGDARTLALSRRFGLALAAMQVVQLLGGRTGRIAMMARVVEHLAPGRPLRRGAGRPIRVRSAGRRPAPASRTSPRWRAGCSRAARWTCARSRAAWPWTACASWCPPRAS